MKRFAVLQLSGCAGCEVSLLNADEWVDRFKLVYMPLVVSTYDIPEVDMLLISGGVRTDEDLYKLRSAVKRADQVVAVGTCAISGGVANLGDRDEVREVFFAEAQRHHVPRLLAKSHPVDAYVDVDLYLPGCPPTPESTSSQTTGGTGSAAIAPGPPTGDWPTGVNPERGSGKVRIWHAFNSLPTTRREAIEITVWDWPGDMRFIAVEDAQGALHLDDILARRTRISIESWDRGAAAAPVAARLMGEVLGWDEARIEAEVAHWMQRIEAERASQEQPDDADPTTPPAPIWIKSLATRDGDAPLELSSEFDDAPPANDQ